MAAVGEWYAEPLDGMSWWSGVPNYHPDPWEERFDPKGMEVPMNTGPAFWLIVTVGGAVLLGVALAYGLISTRSRRKRPDKNRSESQRKAPLR